MTPLRVLTSAVALAASLSLAGCVFLPMPDPAGPVNTPEPSATATPDAAEAPSEADPEIMVLSDDDVTEVTRFTRSEPAGTWPIGPGAPDGFPAGVPFYPDRWVKNNVNEFTSGNNPGYSAMFWGGYDDIDELAVRFRELGYEMEEQQDDTKRVIIFDTERYRVIVNATETAVDPQTKELLDPAYTYTIVYLD